MLPENLLVIDFETYYNRKEKYDLKSISMAEYMRDSRFKVHGFAYKWIGEEQSAKWRLPFPKEPWHNVDWTNTAVIAHNCKFDGSILAWKYGIKPAMWIDTMAMARAVLGTTAKSFSLGALAEHFGLPAKGDLQACNVEGKRELSAEEERALASYCEHDTDLCAELFMRLQEQFPESEYWHMDWTLRNYIDPVLQLNTTVLEKAHEEEKTRREAFFAQPGMDKKLFASNQKFAALLEKEGFEVPTKLSPRTGKHIPALALGDTEFIEMRDSENPRLKELCEARVAAKSTLMETRTGKLASISKTGKWPFDTQYSGAKQTHRYSGGSGAGGNPQNFTRDSALREAVEAPKGMSLIVADFSNIELRIAAALSRESRLMQMIKDNIDVYCDFASQFYGRQITDNDKEERLFGKTAILGLQYNMGPEKFKKTAKLRANVELTKEEADKAVFLYRLRYSGITSYWEYLQNVIKLLVGGTIGKLNKSPLELKSQALQLPSGLKLRYPGLKAEGRGFAFTAYRRAKEPESVKLYGGKLLENICQALAGEICKLVIKRVENGGIRCVGMVHDEILAVVKDKDLEEAAAFISEAMTIVPDWLPDLKLDAEVGAGKNWKSAKTKKLAEIEA